MRHTEAPARGNHWALRSDYPGMEFGEHGPVAPTTGTRYCRARRRRGVMPAGALTVRHGPAGLLLSRAAAVVGPASPGRSRRGRLGWIVALGIGLTATTLLLTGASLAPAPAEGPCPARTSTAAYAGGRQLLLRAEPVRSGTALLHLCAETAIGRVRSWSVVTGRGSRWPLKWSPPTWPWRPCRW